MSCSLRSKQPDLYCYREGELDGTWLLVLLLQLGCIIRVSGRHPGLDCSPPNHLERIAHLFNERFVSPLTINMYSSQSMGGIWHTPSSDSQYRDEHTIHIIIVHQTIRAIEQAMVN